MLFTHDKWVFMNSHVVVFQLEGCFPDTMTRCAELLNQNIDVDFVDINSGCPIDLVYKKVIYRKPGWEAFDIPLGLEKWHWVVFPV